MGLLKLVAGLAMAGASLIALFLLLMILAAIWGVRC